MTIKNKNTKFLIALTILMMIMTTVGLFSHQTAFAFSNKYDSGQRYDSGYKDGCDNIKKQGLDGVDIDMATKYRDSYTYRHHSQFYQQG
jgi:hypothetical protein